MSLIDDDLSVAKISEISHCSDLFVRQVLFSLIEKGKLKIVNPQIVELENSTDLVNPDDITATTHLGIAQRRIDNADFSNALRHLGAAHNLDPNGQETAHAIETAEERIRQSLDQEGIQLSAIPTLNLSKKEIPTLQLSPEEGFVLSRIDGTYDIDSILKISPMPPLDARLVFRKLLKAPSAPRRYPGSRRRRNRLRTRLGEPSDGRSSRSRPPRFRCSISSAHRTRIRCTESIRADTACGDISGIRPDKRSLTGLIDIWAR